MNDDEVRTLILHELKVLTHHLTPAPPEPAWMKWGMRALGIAGVFLSAYIGAQVQMATLVERVSGLVAVVSENKSEINKLRDWQSRHVEFYHPPARETWPQQRGGSK